MAKPPHVPWRYNDEPAAARLFAQGSLDSMRNDCVDALDTIGCWGELGAPFYDSGACDVDNESELRVQSMARQLIEQAAASQTAIIHGTPEHVFARHRATIAEACRLLRSVTDAPDMAAWLAYFDAVPKPTPPK